MKHLLLFCTLLLSAFTISAQDTLWTEDFSQGLTGWTVNTLQCGANTGGALGKYELTGGTLEGSDIIALGDEIEFSFLNVNEYMVQYRFANFEVTAYSLYEIENDTLKSSMDGAALTTGTSFSELSAGGVVEWATYMPDGVNVAGVGNVLGANDPMITFSADSSSMTLTASAGTVLEFDRVSDCGGNWVWSPNGNLARGGQFDQPAGTAINSPTVANGSMHMHSLYQNGLGANPYGPSAPWPDIVSELISPPIDLTDVDRALQIGFSQAARIFVNVAGGGAVDAADNPLQTSFSVSTDGGATWSPAINMNPNLAVNAPLFNDHLTLPIPSGLTSGASEMLVKFSWSSPFYVWAIDDITISERGGADMQANQNFFAIAPNIITPETQVDDVRFLADIQNNGGVAGENVYLNVTVTSDADGSVVYNDSLFYGEIPPDSLAENQLFPTFLDGDLLEEGTYSGTYFLTYDGEEEVTDNDVLDFAFAVSDSLFSKETGRTRAVRAAADLSFYYGNAFYVPNGEGLFARHISFGVTNPSEVAASGDGVIATYLYRWDGDTNADNLANPDEYGGVPIAFNEYVFTGDEPDGAIITIPFDIEGNAVELEDDVYYIAIVQFVSTGEEDELFLEASEQYDYGAMVLASASAEAPRYAGMLVVGNPDEPEFSTVGFGRDIVPVVRMSVGDNPDLSGPAFITINTDEALPDSYSMEVYPNPASERFTLKLDMEDTVERATIQLFSATGQLIWNQSYSNLLNGNFEYDVTNLPAGNYTVRLQTEKGSRTQKVIVVK